MGEWGVWGVRGKRWEEGGGNGRCAWVCGLFGVNRGMDGKGDGCDELNT